MACKARARLKQAMTAADAAAASAAASASFIAPRDWPGGSIGWGSTEGSKGTLVGISERASK